MNAFSTRREFLKSSAVAGAAITLGEFALRPARAAVAPRVVARGAIPPAPSWVDKPMRWAQLTLVEDDPGKFDLQFWLDYFARTKSDAVCLSGGGCVAYYPTQIPFHHRSAWLGESDPFGRRQFLEWRKARLTELWKRWDATVRARLWMWLPCDNSLHCCVGAPRRNAPAPLAGAGGSGGM